MYLISGDCDTVCKSELLSDGICHFQNNNPECDLDGGDCVCNPFINDEFCDQDNNKFECEYDNGECLGKRILNILKVKEFKIPANL